MLVTRLTMSTPMWFSVGAAVVTITSEGKIEMFFCCFSADPSWTYLDMEGAVCRSRKTLHGLL